MVVHVEVVWCVVWVVVACYGLLPCDIVLLCVSLVDVGCDGVLQCVVALLVGVSA